MYIWRYATSGCLLRSIPGGSEVLWEALIAVEFIIFCLTFNFEGAMNRGIVQAASEPLIESMPCKLGALI
jgi:hypothetical protein